MDRAQKTAEAADALIGILLWAERRYPLQRHPGEGWRAFLRRTLPPAARETLQQLEPRIAQEERGNPPSRLSSERSAGSQSRRRRRPVLPCNTQSYGVLPREGVLPRNTQSYAVLPTPGGVHGRG